MASTARTVTRALRTARTARFAPAQTFRQTARRGYASGAGKEGTSEGGNPKGMLFGAGLCVVAAAGWATYKYNPELFGLESAPKAPFVPRFENYQQVYDAIAKKLQDEDNYDDGSYGPVLVRLAWHASGTYDAETKTGGSNGATMRFAPEGDHGANAGLKAARDFLEPIKGTFCRFQSWE